MQKQLKEKYSFGRALFHYFQSVDEEFQGWSNEWDCKEHYQAVIKELRSQNEEQP